MEIDGKTKVFCVIGDPIEHTLSPAMHNTAFEELGLNCVYTAFRVVGSDLRDAVRGFRALGMEGINVTIPHKVAVIKYLDDLSEEARIIGAVNTVKLGERLVGYNTDGDGALQALISRGADPEGKDVLLLGSGGAARAIAVTLALKGGVNSLRLRGIDEKELKKLAADVEAGTDANVNWGIFNEDTKQRELQEIDILIHCTPVGMAPKVEQTLLRAGEIPDHIKLMDIVYTPLETKLMREAKKAGVRVVIGGVEMFVNQGAEALRIWLNIEPPVDLMKKAVLENLRG